MNKTELIAAVAENKRNLQKRRRKSDESIHRCYF